MDPKTQPTQHVGNCDEDTGLAQTRECLLAIARITTPVIGTRPLAELVDGLIGEVCRAYRVDAAVLRMLDGDDLVLFAAHGIPSEQLSPRLPAHEGISARLISEGKLLAIQDVAQDPTTARLASQALTDPAKFRFTSYAGAPLLMEGRVVGLFGIYSIDVPRAFTELELENLQILANHIAICMANERLYGLLASKQVELEKEISRRDQMEQERSRLEEQLRHAQKMEALGQLAGGISHDFNNILTVILGNAVLLQEVLRAAGVPERMLGPLLEVEKAVDHAVALTRQLLAFSRRQPTNMLVLDLVQLVRQTEGMLRRLVREDIQLHVECDSRPCPVRADAAQLRQVLINMIINACDATPQSGRIEVWCRHVEEPNGLNAAAGRSCVLGVRDNGMGMTPEVRARIFEPFFTTKPAGGGTGLGLSMAYGIVAQVGGRIEVETAPARGTTFRVFLPVCDESVDAVPASPATPSKRGCGGGLVLVCEDNSAVRKVVTDTLRAEGYEVLDAADGLTALELASGEPRSLDLLITDLVMPVMGGQELARRLRGLRPGLPILFISGYLGDNASLSDLPDHSLILAKPFLPSDLLGKVYQSMHI